MSRRDPVVPFECPRVAWPPDVVLRQWSKAGTELKDYDYVERWTKFVDRYAAKMYEVHNSWDLDWDRFVSFVEHERLAEMHRIIAGKEPFPLSATGNVKAHPGWEIAQREERVAQRIAEDLGLRKKRTYTSSNGGGADPLTDDSVSPVADDMADL